MKRPPIQTTVRNTEGSEFKTYFTEVMRKANKPGMDFFEFFNILKSNDSLPLSDAEKYRASFEAFRQSGVSMNDLVVSAREYLKTFSEEASTNYAKLSDEKIAGVDNKDKKIEELKAENNRLQTQMATNLRMITQLTQESAEARVKATTQKEQFTIAYENAVNQVTTIVNNIKMYLNGTT